MLLESNSGRMPGSGLHVSVDMPLLCAVHWDLGSGTTVEIQGDSSPMPLWWEDPQLGSPLSSSYALTVSGSCVGRVAGIQVSCEGFREGQPSSGSAVVSKEFAGQGDVCLIW